MSYRKSRPLKKKLRPSLTLCIISIFNQLYFCIGFKRFCKGCIFFKVAVYFLIVSRWLSRWGGGYYPKQPPSLPKNKIPLLARSWTTEFWQATKLIVILNIPDNIHVMCGILSMIKPISLIFCAL